MIGQRGDVSEEELPPVCKPAASQGFHLSSEAEGLSEAHSHQSPVPVAVLESKKAAF